MLAVIDTSLEEITTFLRQSLLSLSDPLDEGSLADVDKIAAQCRVQQFEEGEILMNEGEPGDTVYVIREGHVDIVKGYHTPTPLTIARRGKGEVVGEMSLDNDKPRFATVVACEGLKTVVIPFDALHGTSIKWRLLWQMGRKLREAQEGRYQEIQRRNRELVGVTSLQDAFLSVVRHELMTPITRSVMSAALLRQTLPAEVLEDSGLVRLLDILESSLVETKDEIQSLIDYASMAGSDKKVFSRDIVPFNEVIRSLIERKYKNEGVELDSMTTIPVFVIGDQRRLMEAMANLINNAVKYSPESVRVLVQVWEERGLVNFVVQDSGPGVPKEMQEEIWKPFVQVALPILRSVEGLGLGLTLTRQIVQAHNGDVWVNSEVGKGSEFGFWLPIAKEADLENASEAN